MTLNGDRITKSYSVFDCDAHVNDPLEIWEEYLPKGTEDLVRQTYWRTDQGAMVNGDTPAMGGGNDEFAPMYNPILIAGPQMNKKIMRKLISMMPLTDEQREYVRHAGGYRRPQPHHRDGPYGDRSGAGHSDDGHHEPAVRGERRGSRRVLPGL